MTVAYLDSSAFLKLVLTEVETAALRRWLRTRPARASAALLHVEALRTADLYGGEVVRATRERLQDVDLIALTQDLLEDAATLPTEPRLRSLDAIHLAAARSLGADLAALVTYDKRMAGAARGLSLTVVAPGRTDR